LIASRVHKRFSRYAGYDVYVESDGDKERTALDPFSTPDDARLPIERAIRDAIASWKSVDIDLDATIAEWAAREVERLPRPGARDDFSQLCEAGCHPSVLGVLLALIRREPALSSAWNGAVGPLVPAHENWTAS
jgi:hypothetical protein